MKKNILLACIASLLLSPAFANNEPGSTVKETIVQPSSAQQQAEIKIPSADEIKSSFTNFILRQTQLGQLFDLSKMTVSTQGNDFILTLPESKIPVSTPEKQQVAITVPEKKISLIYDGDFNGEPQYRVDAVFETMQSLVKEIVPDADLTTEGIKSDIFWVPRYNLVSKNAQNIKNLKLTLPPVLELTIGALVSDSLTRPTGNNKMDRSDLQDAKDITLSSEGLVLSIPTFSFENNIQGSELSSIAIHQLTSSENAFFKINIPTIVAATEKGELLGSTSFTADGRYKDSNIHLNIKLNNISLNKTVIPMPPVFLPEEIFIDLDVKNLDKEWLNIFLSNDTTATEQQRQEALRGLISNSFIQLNKVEIKNSEAGISVSGTLKTQKNDIGWPQTSAHLIAYITNLDKISPEPKIDELQCTQVKKQMESLSDRNIAEKAVQNACAPRGGILDICRKFINPNERIINTKGDTVDTLDIIFENGKVTINKKELK